MTVEAMAPRDGQATDARGAVVTARDVAETAMRAVVEIDAAIAGLQAMRSELLAGIGHVAIDDARAEGLDAGIGIRDVASEIALLERRHDRTVEAEVDRAMAERQLWPATMRAWRQARIHRGHVAVIAEIGGPLREPEARAAFELALLPHASVTSPGRLRRLARRELERHLDRPLAERHRQARERRGVFLTELDDGCSRLVADVPTALGVGILDRLTQMAKILARAGRAGGARVSADARGAAGDSRTFDQLRADLLCDLLLTGEPTGAPLAGIRADVSIVVPAPVLTEPDGMHRRRATGDARDHEEPAGRGAARAGAGREAERAVARCSSGASVDPGTARLLAERASSWTRLFADPLTGHVTAVDTYTPSAQMRKLLRARDQHCRWPGCTQRAMRCDVDHTIPWAEGGPTELGNLAHLCRRHHALKGAPLAGARRWKVRQLGAGVLEFISPTGQRAIDQPTPVVPAFRDRGDVWEPPADALLSTDVGF